MCDTGHRPSDYPLSRNEARFFEGASQILAAVLVVGLMLGVAWALAAVIK